MDLVCVPDSILTPNLQKFILKNGDILIAMTGATAGKVGKLRTNIQMLLNQRVAKIEPFEVDKRFIWSVVSSAEYRETFFRLADGAAQPNMSGTQIENTRVLLPPLPTQRKIGSILSAYDDLIENNLRRIKILEEMAQALYREWFVKFRFPGHEKVRMKESSLGKIPEEWEVSPMKAVAEVVDCLHSKKPSAVEDGAGILLQLFNIGDGGKINLSKRYMISSDDYERWTSRIEVAAGDCVVTNVGRIAAVAQIPAGVRAAIGRNMTAVRPKAGFLAPTYLIEYLLSSHMEDEVMRKKDAGAIMDSLNVRGIYKLSVPIPSGGLMNRFESVARPMRRRIELLMQQNQNLRLTLDLLLPKLISGDIDVSNLDIDIGEVAAA